MEPPPASPIALINRGVAAYHDGASDEALRLFAQALLVDPESELGWLWFAAVTDDPAEKRYALDRAVSINPDSIGAAARKRMLAVTPVMPNELTDIGAPPLPPELADLELRPRFVPRLPRPRLARAVAAGARGVRWRWVGTIALLVALAAAGAFLVQRSQPPARWYLAVAGPLSGPDSRVGIEMANAAELAIARVNAAGGIAGRQIALLRYDDQGNPDVARDVAAEIVADARPLLVLGHRTSAPSIAAGEVYGEAGIAAISGSATADALTADNPWYFRTIFPNSFEGSLLATYVRDVLGHDTASVITTHASVRAVAVHGVHDGVLRDRHGQADRCARPRQSRGIDSLHRRCAGRRSRSRHRRDLPAAGGRAGPAAGPPPRRAVAATDRRRRPGRRGIRRTVRRRAGGAGATGILHGGDVRRGADDLRRHRRRRARVRPALPGNVRLLALLAGGQGVRRRNDGHPRPLRSGARR